MQSGFVKCIYSSPRLKTDFDLAMYVREGHFVCRSDMTPCISRS